MVSRTADLLIVAGVALLAFGTISATGGALSHTSVLPYLLGALPFWLVGALLLGSGVRSRQGGLTSFGRFLIKLLGSLLLALALAQLPFAFLVADRAAAPLALLFGALGASLWWAALRATPEIPAPLVRPSSPTGPWTVDGGASKEAGGPAGPTSPPPPPLATSPGTVDPLEAGRLASLRAEAKSQGALAIAGYRGWVRIYEGGMIVVLVAIAGFLLAAALRGSGPAEPVLAISIAIDAVAWVAILAGLELDLRHLEGSLAPDRPAPERLPFGLLGRLLAARRRRRVGEEVAEPPEPEEPESLLDQSWAWLVLGRRLVRDARRLAVVAFLLGWLVGGAAATSVTIVLLLRFAGGASELPRYLPLAGAVGLAVALVLLALLYRAYRALDRVERRFASLETAAAELERSFWSRY